MSGSTQGQSGSGQAKESRAGEFPSSNVHTQGNETSGPTPGHEVATDAKQAANERGEHSQLPVEGGAEVEKARQERTS
jgi:hypothetical protein